MRKFYSIALASLVASSFGCSRAKDQSNGRKFNDQGEIVEHLFTGRVESFGIHVNEVSTNHYVYMGLFPGKEGVNEIWRLSCSPEDGILKDATIN